MGKEITYKTVERDVIRNFRHEYKDKYAHLNDAIKKLTRLLFFVPALIVKLVRDSKIRRDIRRDMVNGQLMQRYLEEVLPRKAAQLQRLPEQKAIAEAQKLQAKFILTQEFMKALSKSKPTPRPKAPTPTVYGPDGSPMF